MALQPDIQYSTRDIFFYKTWIFTWIIPTQCISLCRQESSSRRNPFRSAVHLEHCTVAILCSSSLSLSPSTERQEASRDDAAAQPLILLPLFARTQPAVCTVAPPAPLLRYYNQCHVCKPGLNRNNKFTAAKKVMFLLAFISLFFVCFFPQISVDGGVKALINLKRNWLNS